MLLCLFGNLIVFAFQINIYKDEILNPDNPIDKPDCRKCAKALQELENIDDEADQLGIGFVKIHDEDLANEYNLGSLPALVYYRHQTPIIYEGIQHRSANHNPQC